uniref:Transmembrane protein n=1 Tax=Steinernema glaseri TaxID=37863 RepID=A0A1I7YU62_9BILA
MVVSPYDASFRIILVNLEFQKENEELDKLKANGTEAEQKTEVAPIRVAHNLNDLTDVSASQFTFEALYSVYLCFLTWCTLEFLSNDEDGFTLWKTLVLSLACASGAYAAGNVQNRSASFVFAFQGAFMLMFILSYITSNVLFICIMPSCAAVIFVHIVNFYRKPLNRKNFTLSNFIFWTSVFNLLLATLFIGISRQVFDLRVTARDKASKSSSTASLGTLTTNYLFFNREQTETFFKDFKDIHYNLPSSYKKENTKWIHYLGVALTDYLRYDVNYHHNPKIKDLPSPLKWVSWRLWLLVNVFLSPHSNDKAISEKCVEINKQMPTALRINLPLKDDANVFSPTFACHRFTVGLKVFH